ncbi:response regulator transcription factor [Kitasatospora sp. NPDC087315]|uniref:response regulator transcription factor n=1 Tax=Kitasatospora sp. NPDC087315 TaxID=3364069 RepID=UPI0037FB0F28
MYRSPARPPFVEGRPCTTCGTRLVLTARESDVLDLIALGKTNDQIADAHKASLHAARTWVDNILDALHATGRVQAVDTACRVGLLNPPATLRSSDEEPKVPELELEAFRLKAVGRSKKRIAQELSLSPHTVKSRLHRLYKRLGADGAAHAALILHGLKLLPSSHPCHTSETTGAAR